jgi:serine/threonine-protein phosphatase 2A regulatory subunit A
MIPLLTPQLVPYLSTEAVEKTVIPFLLNQVTDKVANIRFNIAKALKAIVPYVKSSTLQAAITKGLAQLAADSDPDVRYYSSKYTTTA